MVVFFKYLFDERYLRGALRDNWLKLFDKQVGALPSQCRCGVDRAAGSMAASPAWTLPWNPWGVPCLPHQQRPWPPPPPPRMRMWGGHGRVCCAAPRAPQGQVTERESKPQATTTTVFRTSARGGLNWATAPGLRGLHPTLAPPPAPAPAHAVCGWHHSAAAGVQAEGRAAAGRTGGAGVLHKAHGARALAPAWFLRWSAATCWCCARSAWRALLAAA